jgi:hypothetical protein
VLGDLFELNIKLVRKGKFGSNDLLSSCLIMRHQFERSVALPTDCVFECRKRLVAVLSVCMWMNCNTLENDRTSPTFCIFTTTLLSNNSIWFTWRYLTTVVCVEWCWRWLYLWVEDLEFWCLCYCNYIGAVMYILTSHGCSDVYLNITWAQWCVS